MEHLRDRSLALLRARWLAVALLLGAVLVRVARAEPITAPVLGVVLALPLFNLAATLVRRVGLPAPTVARLVLVQCVADAAAVALVAQSWPAPFLLALVLVPISVARDDLGWRRVVLVAAVATLVWIGTGAWLCDGPIVPVLWPPAAVVSAALLLLWLRLPQPASGSRESQRAKASVLWQMAQSVAAPLAARAGMIRARADHIELVLPDGDVPAIVSAGRVIRESADEIQHLLRPWRSLLHPSDRTVDLGAWLGDFARRHAATRPGAAAAPAIIIERIGTEKSELNGHGLQVSEGGAHSALLLLEALAVRSRGALRVQLCPTRSTVLVTLSSEAAERSLREPADRRGWSRLLLRAALSLAQEIDGSLILWRRGRSVRGVDLKLPRLDRPAC